MREHSKLKETFSVSEGWMEACVLSHTNYYVKVHARPSTWRAENVKVMKESLLLCQGSRGTTLLNKQVLGMLSPFNFNREKFVSDATRNLKHSHRPKCSPVARDMTAR